jgi:hypothetical protein
MRKKLAILALAVAAAIPGASFAKGGNFECPGGPPGHCKNGPPGHGNSQQQQQQQQQDQQQSQCLISIAIAGDATCGP